jgi:hypothetical protein
MPKIPLAPKPCAHHITVKEGYLEWHTWAEAQKKKKIKQTQCTTCGHWFFPEEMGQQPGVLF